ncbi:CDP-alcohol phosphatidyltransferase family protein [Aquamicrobium sp. NLF2-7]|uniref:CDP-alcohol phosphatidyltransferase family protein n=1 Tax=Aquamicrobium sp. NLF2-7 TaxID=2918753 RepID=UPI001EFB63EF|nr:CDP-alcohol phosphatidyltransferase family protein [Aquamicrobium sp. NLF2-7]MCG8273812.1 CDP-alcohol phosphatidyltransferase family protein [Aquamicrobium sp. NLF2-7]MCG8273964.1 CDP-alcohol phosphatidyltransferase family protein [Aquamicrobium sp. NLF2-7]
MIRQLFDPANAVTAAGLVLSVIAISLALSGRVELGVAVALWALLADHLDGVVAQRLTTRAERAGEVGKNLDSLADLVSAGVFPGIVLLVVGGSAALFVAVAALLAAASALRLSYFNVFGSPGGRFIGVPTTYAVPLTAILFLVRPLFPDQTFPFALALGIGAIAVLHVAPFRVPKTAGVMYIVVTLFCVALSVILASRGLS